MIELQQIKRIISNFHEKEGPKLRQRMLDVPLNLGKIAVMPATVRTLSIVDWLLEDAGPDSRRGTMKVGRYL